MSFCGRGMLPIGSVGMVIPNPRRDSDARQALRPLTSILHGSRTPPAAATSIALRTCGCWPTTKERSICGGFLGVSDCVYIITTSDEIQIEPHTPSPQPRDRVDVRSQTDVRLQEIPLIKDDPDALAAPMLYAPDRTNHLWHGCSEC